MKKRILCLLVCVFLLFSLTACGEVAYVQPKFDANTQSAPPSKNLIAERGDLRLEWNDANYGVVLTNTKTGEVWGSSPEDDGEVILDMFGLPVKRNPLLESALVVYYYNSVAFTSNNLVNSYNGVYEEGHVRCAFIENGLHVEYFFDSLGFMVPVDYVLCDGYLSVSVDPKKIQDGENRVTSVALLPFMCSAKNDAEGEYLFVPSGSGAIIEPETISQAGITYLAEIYGGDLSKESLYSVSEEADIKLPVYGVKNATSGLCAIIDRGEGTASLTAPVGAMSYGYTTVYPEFQLKGYTIHTSNTFNGSLRNYIISAQSMVTSPVSVRYYPLVGEANDYNGMANVYRDYLIAEKGLTENKNDARLNVELIGGTSITKSFLGVPYNTIFATTKIKDAQKIVSELSSELDTDFSVNLKGFGSSGVNIGGIAGGYSLSDKIGSVSELKKFSSLCDEEKVDLYMDFNVVQYKSSGKGFSTFFDSAFRSSREPAYVYEHTIPIRNIIKSDFYYLLSPNLFDDAAKKLVDKTSSWGLDGVSLSTLSSLSYADYRDKTSTEFYSKYGFANAVEKAVKTVKNDGKFMAENANAFAAVSADIIAAAPTSSSNEHVFTTDVPFYQLVFKGYVPMTTESVNISTIPEKTILSAVESGIGLNYTLISKWDNSLIDAKFQYFYSTQYEGVKDDIISNSNKLSNYYEKIAGAKIKSHTLISNDVRATEFDNGVTVYVNYSSKAKQTPAGKLAALDYVVLESVS